MTAEFGGRPDKPPNGSKPPVQQPADLDEHPASSASEGEMAGPRPFAGAEPVAEQAFGDGDGNPKGHLRSVGPGAPPKEEPLSMMRAETEDEREQVETDTIRAENEAIRSETAIEEKRAASEIKIAENHADVEDEAIEVDTRTTDKERIFSMGMVAIGVLAALVLAFLSIGQPLEYRLSPLAGVFVSGWGGLRLRAITRNLKHLSTALGERTNAKEADS
jgi:hypothetical protein